MLDWKYVRDHQDEVISRLRHRLEDTSVISTLVKQGAELTSANQRVQNLNAERKSLTAEFQQAMSIAIDETVVALKTRIRDLKGDIQEAEVAAELAGTRLREAASNIPNIPAEGVPSGPDESGNIEVYKGGNGGAKHSFSFTPKEHFDLGARFGMDFETAAKTSGSRFVFLKGAVARLERALGQYMLNYHCYHGYTEVSPPLLVKSDTMFGTGQLPKFEDDLFRTTDYRYMIPTAEVSLTNMVRESVLDGRELPLRYVALTPCFRAEAGSAGRDTRGMIRQHQFNKVELVSITPADPEFTDPEDGELFRMRALVETMLESLGLHFRTVLLCSGDMGFSARKTFDIEVWLPGQNAYREISSVSYCGDFQARRMEARYRPTAGVKGTEFVHTFNGSGVAVGRALVAILETYQREDGNITIPRVLRGYMNGAETLADFG